MKITLLLVALLCFSLCNAQIIFEKGYFIDEKDVRTECFIENVDWRDNPTQFAYKISLQDETANSATILKIKEFGIDNVSKYQRFKVNIERSSDEISKLTTNQYADFKEELLFLKVLVEGNASLYNYHSGNIDKYFFATKKTPTEQLLSIKYLVDATTSNIKKLYRQQLLINVRSEGMSESYFKTLRYTKTDLVKHFVKYNSETDGATTDYSKKRDVKPLALKATVGVFAGSLNVTDPNTLYNVGTSIAGTAFKGGFEVDYFLPFNKNTWSIFVNPMFNNFQKEEEYSKTNSSVSGGEINYMATVKYTSLEVPVGVRYHNYLKNGSEIFVNFGYSFDFTFNSSIYFDNSNNLTNAKENIEINSGGLLLFGAGYNYKKLSAELRFNFTRNIAPNHGIYWSADYKAIGIVLGYKIL